MVEENLRREKVAEKYTDLGGSSSSPPITVLDNLCKFSHLTQPHFYDFLIIYVLISPLCIYCICKIRMNFPFLTRGIGDQLS